MPGLTCPAGCSPLDATEVVGTLTFDDTSCNAITADTCIPFVIPTDSSYHEPNTPTGQIRMDKLVQRIPDSITLPQPSDMVGSTDQTILNRAARDAYNAIREYCNLAQWGVLTEELWGYPRASIAWASEIDAIGLEFNPKTSTINGAQLKTQTWGDVGERPVDDLVYATHKFRPFDSRFTVCNQGQKHDWGKAAITSFLAPAFTSNQPMPRSGARIAPRQTVSLDAGSMALLTVTGVSQPVAIELQGSLEVTIGSCSQAGACDATLSALAITASPFTIQGLHVTGLDVFSYKTTQGVLQGNLLAFPAFSGSIETHLDDGRWDSLPVNTGVVLARWDVAQNRFVMAFSISGTQDGETATLDGSVTGAFTNTSPTAVIRVSSPASTLNAETATVECLGPTGTTVQLDSSSTSDREDSTLKVSWYEGDQVVSREPMLELANLPVGSRSISLLAYDRGGFVGQAVLDVAVVDSLGPQINASDICVFPPNKREVCVGLFDDLAIAVVDQCQGNITSTATIVGVSVVSGPPLTSWNASQVCFPVDRDGASGDTVYRAQVEATDAAGNVAHRDISISVPHDLRHGRRCLHTKALGGVK